MKGKNKMDKQEEKRFRNLLKKQNKNKLIDECVLLYKQANKFYKEITIKKLKQINE
jgi:hypothetical protein